MSPPVRISYRPAYGVALMESILAPAPRRGSISFLMVSFSAASSGGGVSAPTQDAISADSSNRVNLLFFMTSPKTANKSAAKDYAGSPRCTTVVSTDRRIGGRLTLAAEGVRNQAALQHR